MTMTSFSTQLLYFAWHSFLQMKTRFFCFLLEEASPTFHSYSLLLSGTTYPTRNVFVREYL